MLTADAPAGATGSVFVRTDDGSMATVSIPIVTKEARLRPSREKIIARIGSGTQAIRSLCGRGDANTLRNEPILLYNEGQAPLVIRNITINDADWASIHPVQNGVDLSTEGMTIQPMSLPAELFVCIDSSVRASHSLSGTICISSNDPRPDILVPLEASFAFLRACRRAVIVSTRSLLLLSSDATPPHFVGHDWSTRLDFPDYWTADSTAAWREWCRWCWRQCSEGCLHLTRRCRPISTSFLANGC